MNAAKRLFVLGLTGSIGMGKSTTSAFFRDDGIAVWDADQTVHDLYAKGGAGSAALVALWPEAVIDGAVDRAALRQIIAADATALPRIEASIHPLVAADRAAFLAGAAKAGEKLAVLDIPLLFETGASDLCDAILVVSAPEAVQMQRIMARPGLTPDHVQMILSKQLPDAEKRARADYVIETIALEPTRAAVRILIANLTGAN
jgi:dephospho-CoA kinase